jgi:hypothetical protein
MGSPCCHNFTWPTPTFKPTGVRSIDGVSQACCTNETHVHTLCLTPCMFSNILSVLRACFLFCVLLLPARNLFRPSPLLAAVIGTRSRRSIGRVHDRSVDLNTVIIWNGLLQPSLPRQMPSRWRRSSPLRSCRPYNTPHRSRGISLYISRWAT